MISLKYYTQMDLQGFLTHDNDLIIETDKIACLADNLPASSQLLLTLNSMLKSKSYPQCMHCQRQLFHHPLVFYYSELYCIECWKYYRNPDEFCIQPRHLDGYETINLGAQLFDDQQWSLGDHLELSALIESQLQKQDSSQRLNLLDIGTKMTNSKDARQILMYLRRVNYQSCYKQNKTLEERPLSPLITSQSLDISYKCLSPHEEGSLTMTFFDKIKKAEDHTLCQLREGLSPTAERNKGAIQFLNQTIIQETYRKISIYQSLFQELGKTTNQSQTKSDFHRLTEATEDITFNLEAKQPEISREVSSVELKEADLLFRFEQLMSRRNPVQETKQKERGKEKKIKKEKRHGRNHH